MTEPLHGTDEMWDEINKLTRERMRQFNPMSDDDIADLWGPPPSDEPDEDNEL